MAWHFDEKLHLGVRCDPHVFTREEGQKLIDMFADRMASLVAAPAGESTRRSDAA
jgi:creatinine amidohydrolase/Fe(II)-dependent formamide hydrolase-like protein